MKTLILLLFTLISFAQSKETIVKDIFIEFQKEASLRGLKYDLSKVKFNIINSTDVYGTTSITTKELNFTTELFKYPMALKLIVFHEIGHLLTNSSYHSCVRCDDVMSSIGFDEEKKYNPELWQKVLDTFFEYLRENVK